MNNQEKSDVLPHILVSDGMVINHGVGLSASLDGLITEPIRVDKGQTYLSLRDQYEQETSGSVFSEDYVDWLESKILEQENVATYSQKILTLVNKEGVDALMTFFKNLTCTGYVFSWHEYISDEVINFINGQGSVQFERYICGSYKVVKI